MQTKEGGESLDHSMQKAGAKADEKDAKADTKSYLSSAWDSAKDTMSSLTDAAGNKADKHKHSASAKVCLLSQVYHSMCQPRATVEHVIQLSICQPELSPMLTGL